MASEFPARLFEPKICYFAVDDLQHHRVDDPLDKHIVDIVSDDRGKGVHHHGDAGDAFSGPTEHGRDYLRLQMMNPLPDINSLIENGPFIRPQRVIVYGPPAVGKSTLASKFPNPLFIDAEDGSLRLDVRRIRTLDGDTFYNALRGLLRAEKLPCQTAVFDTIDAIEVFIRERVCRIHALKTIEGASYGVGWALFRQEFQRLLAEFDRLINRGIHVVVISHSTVRKFQPPSSDVAYDRFEPSVHQPNSQKLKQWADAVLYMDWDVRVVENRSGKARGVGGKTRVLYTEHCAAFDAKSRVSLPEKLPAEFDALLPLFGPHREEVRKEQDPAAEASPSTEITAPIQHDPELHDNLLDAIGDLENELVVRYLSSRKIIPADGSIDNLSENQTRWIANHAAKFRARVEKFADEPF